MSGKLRECTRSRRVFLVNVATLDWNPNEDIHCRSFLSESSHSGREFKWKRFPRVTLVNVATLDWNPNEDIRSRRASLVKAATLGRNSNEKGLQE